ncbi:MAG: DUF3054 domain-containing protein [Pseudonocardia sp.]
MRVVAVALGADLVGVLVFAAIGRSSHVEGLDILGVAGTAAPFLGGLLVGWAVGQVWRAPARLLAGLWAVGGAAIVGLALRGAVTGRLPWTFVLVASVSLAVLVLGWRLIVRAVLATRRART